MPRKKQQTVRPTDLENQDDEDLQKELNRILEVDIDDEIDNNEEEENEVTIKDPIELTEALDQDVQDEERTYMGYTRKEIEQLRKDLDDQLPLDFESLISPEYLFVTDDGIKVVKAQGLYDLAVLFGIEDINVYNTSVQPHCVTTTCNIVRNKISVSAIADANLENCQPGFEQYLAAMADTRAKVRALRLFFNIRAIGYEELGPRNKSKKKTSDDQFCSKENQILISKLLKTNNMNWDDLFKRFKPLQARLQKVKDSLPNGEERTWTELLTNEEANKMIEWLNKEQRSKK